MGVISTGLGFKIFSLFLTNILLMSTSQKMDGKNLRQALSFVWVRKPNPTQLRKILKNPCHRFILIRLPFMIEHLYPSPAEMRQRIEGFGNFKNVKIFVFGI